MVLWMLGDNMIGIYTAMIILIYKILSALDNGDSVIEVFLNFLKAIDTVDHTILLKKYIHVNWDFDV